MTSASVASRAALSRTINACLSNGERLLDESVTLEFSDVPATRFYLTVISQEESAKAFLIFLIREGIAPLNIAVRRALRDHTCKQLLGIVMDYVIMHWENIEELERMIRLDGDLQGELPHEVDSALALFRYEKIGRWESPIWEWMEDPRYHPDAKRVANGWRDRLKQKALYVGVGSDGSVSSLPDSVPETEVTDEHERARRYIRFVRAVSDASKEGWYDQRRFDLATKALRTMFGVRLGAEAEAGA